MGRALPPGGKLITLEANQDHAAVARANLERAGLSNVVEVRLGRAIDTLPRLAEEGIAPFDFIFIDADKPSSTAYFEWALRLSHPGSLIVVDNVVRKGEIINASSEDPNVQGMRASFDVMAGEPRVTSTVLQMVSGKGYDGMAFSLVL
jgi:predicted O-methyltransferase YrrM